MFLISLNWVSFVYTNTFSVYFFHFGCMLRDPALMKLVFIRG